MLQRHLHGAPLPPMANNHGTYEEEPDLDSVNPLQKPDADLTDVDKMKTELSQTSSKLKRAREESEKAKKAQAKEKELQDAVDKRLAEKPEPEA